MAIRTIETRWLLWADAMTITPDLIIVRPHMAGDRALIAHEMCHCEQMRQIGTLKFFWSYFTDRGFRLRVEVEAYRVQLALAPWSLDRLATLLATRYLLNINHAQAKALLA